METPRADDTVQTEATCDPGRPLGPSAASLAPGRLLALYQISRQLLEQRAPSEVLDTILAALVEHLRPERGCVMAVTADGCFTPLATHNIDLDGPQETWPLSRTILRHVVDGGLAVLASDVAQASPFGSAESAQRFRIRSVLCVPLGARPPRGLLYLDSLSGRRAFTAEDLEFLTAVSVHARLVLERAEEYLRASKALEASGERLALLERELLRHRIVGAAPKLLQAYDSLRRLARTGARVLLRGETGTGKELFARAYAAHSDRSNGPYVPVPIPALASSLVESELFGHVRGAFTEATRDKKGRLEVADGGVLFLDEAGDIEPGVQTKLLRFLDSGELCRVGDTTVRKVNARVVSATNRSLEKDVEAGRFRADLLARLGHAIVIPPLRDRLEDLPRLVEHFLEAYDRGPRRKAFSDEAMDLLMRHPWPFNVRELQQVVERAVCLVDRDVIHPDDLPEYLVSAARASAMLSRQSGVGERPRPLRTVLEDAERQHILRALEFTSGNKRRAIELLGIAPETLYKRLEQYGLHKRVTGDG